MIAIERDGDSYVLVRGDSLWTFEDGAEMNPATVRSVMMDLSSPMAVGFLEEGDSLALMDQGASTVLYDADGAVLVEITFGSGESDRWARHRRGTRPLPK